MENSGTPDPQIEAMWRQMLTHGHRPLKRLQFVFRRLPSSPRCKDCYAPFGGIGGKVTRLFGFGPSRKNPYMCDT